MYSHKINDNLWYVLAFVFDLSTLMLKINVIPYVFIP